MSLCKRLTVSKVSPYLLTYACTKQDKSVAVVSQPGTCLNPARWDGMVLPYHDGTATLVLLTSVQHV